MPQRYQRPYPPEFRREAVSLLRASGRSVRQVTGELGVSTESLRIWSVRTSSIAASATRPTSDEREELRKLRRQVLELQGDREILKSGDFLRAGNRSAASLYRLIEQESQRTARLPLVPDAMHDALRVPRLAAQAAFRQGARRLVVDRADPRHLRRERADLRLTQGVQLGSAGLSSTSTESAFL